MKQPSNRRGRTGLILPSGSRLTLPVFWGRSRWRESVWAISREPLSSSCLQHQAADSLSLAMRYRMHKDNLVQQAWVCSSHRIANTGLVFLFVCSTATFLCFAKKLDVYKLTCTMIIKHLCGRIHLTSSVQISTLRLKWQMGIEHVHLKRTNTENISLWHSISLQHIS